MATDITMAIVTVLSAKPTMCLTDIFFSFIDYALQYE